MTNLKARAFAAYLGSEVVDLFYGNEEGILCGITYETLSVKHKVIHSRNFDEVKLLLKPLSSISDEDLIEVSKMAGNDIEDGFIPNEKERKTFIDCLLDSIDMGILPHHIADYLRSRSYLLPFLGHDLLKENIAIIKTEQ